MGLKMTVKIRAGSTGQLTSSTRPWVIIDLGFSAGNRSCGITVNGQPLPDPAEGYNSLPTKQIGDKHYGMLVPVIREWLANERKKRGSVDEFNLMLEAPLSMAFLSSIGKIKHGNPIARSADEQYIPTEGKAAKKQNRFWYNQPAAGLMMASIHLIQDLTQNLDACTVHVFEGFVSFKDKESGRQGQSHSHDTESLFDGIKELNKENIECVPRPVADYKTTTVVSALTYISGADDHDIPPILRINHDGQPEVFSQH